MMSYAFVGNRQTIRRSWMLICLGLTTIGLIIYLTFCTQPNLVVLYKTTVENIKKPMVEIKKDKLIKKITPKLTKKPKKKYMNGEMFTPAKVSNEEEVRYVAESFPNLPLHFWFKTRDNQWQMYLSNASCGAFPDIFNLNLNNDYWQTIHMSNATVVQVYSAYYDKRKSSGRMVRILSMINKALESFPKNRTLFCQFWFDGENDPVISKMDKLEYMWLDYWHSHQDGTLGPYLLGCSLPESHYNKIPRVVSLVENPCDRATNMLTVVYEESINDKKEFAVCVKGLDFLQIDLSARLVEWIEFLLLMGVNKVFFYHLEAHPRMMKVLDYYKKLDKVDVRHISLPNGHPNVPYLQHIFLKEHNLNQCLDEIIPYNDCFYRNLYLHNYVALLDIDEVIVPLKDKNWHDLIKRAMSYDKSITRYNGFTAENIYFLDKMDKEFPHKGVPSYMHMTQHIYRAQNFTPYGFFVKTIFDTNETRSCHNHWPISVADGSNSHSFSYEDARMQHYRDFCSGDVNCDDYLKDPVKDTRMWDFKDVLIPRVQKTVEEIGLLD